MILFSGCTYNYKHPRVMQSNRIQVKSNYKSDILTVEKKSPTHFDIMSTIINGKPSVMSPVHSTKMTIMLTVVRTIPPS